MGHVRKANRFLRWIRRNCARLGVWFRRLNGPLRLVTISDSAFKAQDFQGLVMRGCVIVLAEAGTPTGGESSHTWRSGQTVECQLLDWYSRKHSRVVRSTYAAELLSVLDAVGQGQILAACFDEVACGAMTAAELLKRRADHAGVLKQDAVLDARGVFDSVTADPIKPPTDRHLQLHAQALREYLDDGSVDRLYWFDTRAMLADGMTKGSVDREALVRFGERGEWHIEGDQPAKVGKGSSAIRS